MNRDDVIRWATQCKMPYDFVTGEIVQIEKLERFAALVAAAEREAFPNLTAVINWLENGCDPKEAAKELRLYAAAISARRKA